VSEKILLVEDNKALAKLLAKKCEVTLNLKVDVAHSKQEAQELIEENCDDYFIALLDLNLPDAPDGEIVDYVLSYNILVIVLTGNIDKKTKALFAEKPIVDYVYKGNMDDVNYIFSMVDRLRKNRQYKVMVVDPSIASRNRTKAILASQQFKVLAAAHGEEALGYFEDNDDISLVVTNYKMPVIDGMELVLELRKKHSKQNLGIIAVTSDSDEGVVAKFLKHGANDFIINPFSKEELICRVNNIIEAQENIQTIANLSNIDPLTGTLNRICFFDQLDQYISEANKTNEPYMLGIINIDHFKKINDKYGHNIGDKVIALIAKKLKDESKGSDLVGRLGGEEFGVVLRNISKEKAVAWFVKMRAKIANEPVVVDKTPINVTVSMGLANRADVEFEEFIDLAEEALIEAKKAGKNRVEIA
jgi:diguanylate cyclase (GGDEF)-like protein